MKIQNISDVNKFFAVIDQCKGTVCNIFSLRISDILEQSSINILLS